MNDYRANAEVVVLARDAADLGDLPSRRGWRKLEPTRGVAEWTDDYSTSCAPLCAKSSLVSRRLMSRAVSQVRALRVRPIPAMPFTSH